MTPHETIDVRPPVELGPVYELLRYSMPVPVRGSGLGRGPVPTVFSTRLVVGGVDGADTVVAPY